MIRVLASVLAVCALAAIATTGGSASSGHRFFLPNDDREGISSNWSGYALEPPADADLEFTSVTSTWKQPKATCSAECHGGKAHACLRHHR